MKTSNLRYTEAFAGSGEFAVVRLVADIMQAQEKSLILLDEPEVSLHPGAQERFIHFLYEQVKKNKHQVIISTHSPTIVRQLPSDAIKIFVMDSNSSKIFLPSQSALPEEAFFYLGEPQPNKLTIIVEDVLAQAIIQHTLRAMRTSEAEIFDVRYYPGGAQALWSYYLPIFSAEGRTKILVLFDGDQCPDPAIRHPVTISEADEHLVEKEIFRISGAKIKFLADGNENGVDSGQLNELKRNFLSWVTKHVDYLPQKLRPEEFIWKNMLHDNFSTNIDADISDPKKRFEFLAKKELGRNDKEKVNSEEILTIQQRRLATISKEHADIVTIKKRLIKFAQEDGLTITEKE